MTTKPKRIAVYVRVSTAEQSVASQLDALTRYCESRSWTIAKVYEDSGISGVVDSRPELNALKTDVTKGKYDVVLVFRFDRLARSTAHLLESLEHFRQHGVDFVSASEGIDTGSSVGRMVFTFLAAVAEFERTIIKERVVAGVQRAQAAGTHCGRPRKGFDIAEAVRLQQAGLGVKQIAKRIGVPRSTVHRALQGLKALETKPHVAVHG